MIDASSWRTWVTLRMKECCGVGNRHNAVLASRSVIWIKAIICNVGRKSQLRDGMSGGCIG